MRKTLSQKEAIRLLERRGWELAIGGKHQVKMVKAGQRPITLPHHTGRELAWIESRDPQAGGSKMTTDRISTMELTANIRHEDGSYWADVSELPGCFASGETLDELSASLREGVDLYLRDAAPGAGNPAARSLRLTAALLSDSTVR